MGDGGRGDGGRGQREGGREKDLKLRPGWGDG
jgi:hypothetical protein